MTSYCVEMSKDGKSGYLWTITDTICLPADLWVKMATVANPQAFGGKSNTPSTLTCTVTPLTPGTLYVFRASCINSYGVRDLHLFLCALHALLCVVLHVESA